VSSCYTKLVFTGELQQSSDVSSLNSMRAHYAYETLVIPKENNPPAALPGSKDKADTSMMARLKVLKDRDTPNSTGTDQQLPDALLFIFALLPRDYI